jgi:glycosyltransferase involved in cell wall biosynthesis
LIDLWFTEKLISESSRAKVPYINYFPQDFSPFYKDWIELIRVCHTPLAMSNFGRDVVLKAVRGAKGGWTRHFDMDVLYHGVDPNIYKPMTKAQRTDIRYQLTKGHPDAFLFGIVGKNTDRKQHPRAMQAYKMFKAMNPNSESRLLMKVGDPVSLSFSGHDLYIYARDLGILNDVIWLDTQNDFIAGVEDHIMAKYYGAMDIYLSATSGEGFGLPTMEAMACGTPVCITDYTTSRELTQGSGYLAGVKTMVTAGMFNANRAMVDIEHLANLMSEAYNDDKQRKIKGKKALKISQKFHWKDLANKADEIIKESISVGY